MPLNGLVSWAWQFLPSMIFSVCPFILSYILIVAIWFHFFRRTELAKAQNDLALLYTDILAHKLTLYGKRDAEGKVRIPGASSGLHIPDFANRIFKEHNKLIDGATEETAETNHTHAERVSENLLTQLRVRRRLGKMYETRAPVNESRKGGQANDTMLPF